MEDINDFELSKVLNDDMKLDELIRRLMGLKNSNKFKRDKNNPYINIEVKYGSEVKVLKMGDIRIDKNNNGESEIFIESRRDGDEKIGRKNDFY